MADQCHRVEFTVHHEPFACELEHQFACADYGKWAEYGDQFHLWNTDVLPVKPLTVEGSEKFLIESCQAFR
jgi:hypothetical protein